MGGDEIGSRDAITVQKDAIIASAGGDCAVADLGGAKAAVDLPDVIERSGELRLPASHHCRRLRSRPIVRDHDLEAAVALAGQCRQHRFECILAIVGRNDDRDQVRHLGAAPVLHSASPATVLACAAVWLNERTCRKCRPTSSPSTKLTRSPTRWPACCGRTRSSWPIPAAPIARQRSPSAWARGSFRFHSRASAICQSRRRRVPARLDFSLDFDERCTPEVRDETLAILAGAPAHDAYLVPRRNYMMGRWIRGSRPVSEFPPAATLPEGNDALRQ